MAKGRVERVDFYSEYGVTLDVAGARHYCTPPLTRNDPIISAAHYVGACRRLARKLGLDLGLGKQDGIGDGATLAFGYGRQSPRRWLLDGGYESYCRYEVAAMGRPDRGGNSPYNNVAVPFAYDLRLSARVVNKWNMLCGWGTAPACPIGIFRLLAAGPSARDIGRGLCRRRKQAHRIVRALYRVSIRGPRGLRYTDERGASSHWRRETHPAWHGAYSTPVEWSPRVLEYFGRMSPELQAAAVHHTLAVLPADVRIVMPRHLPWETIGRTHREMVASPRLRIAWADGARLERLAEGISLAPAYPHIPLALAARICRGESPVAVSDGVLTRREAHLWLAGGAHGAALDWLAARLPGTPAIRNALVARWATTIHERGQWEQLTRTRKIAGPRGQRIEVRYIDRLDEIMPEDLVCGPSTTVADAFEAAAKRAGEAYQNRLLGDHRVISRAPHRWRLYRCMRVLRTPADLAREGRELSHCVGTYVSAVESGESIILALNVLGHRSTAELTPDGRIRQHRAERNGAPHELCERALARFLEKRV